MLKCELRASISIEEGAKTRRIIWLIEATVLHTNTRTNKKCVRFSPSYISYFTEDRTATSNEPPPRPRDPSPSISYICVFLLHVFGFLTLSFLQFFLSRSYCSFLFFLSRSRLLSSFVQLFYGFLTIIVLLLFCVVCVFGVCFWFDVFSVYARSFSGCSCLLHIFYLCM